MTKDEISSMQPGKELDELIVQQVFGWCKGHGVTWITKRTEDGKLVQAWKVPPYSTDISAAWEVVEKLMMDHRYRVDVISDVHCTVNVMTYEGCLADFHAETVTEAICKAALLAVMEELPKGIGTTEDAQAQLEAVGLGLGGEQNNES